MGAIRYVTKVGVLSRATWYELFARGKIRWKQTQWNFLIESKVFRPHPCSIVENVVVMGNFGKKLTQMKKWKCSVSWQPTDIHHDEQVGIGLWKLEKIGICKKWMHQKEIKAHGMTNMKLQIKEKSYKYPDAVFIIEKKGQDELVAIEYELKNQKYWRYLPLLKAYQRITGFDQILFIVPNKATKKSIQRAVSTIRDQGFNKRIEFLDGRIWNSNPAECFSSSVPASVPEAQTSIA